MTHNTKDSIEAPRLQPLYFRGHTEQLCPEPVLHLLLLALHVHPKLRWRDWEYIVSEQITLKPREITIFTLIANSSRSTGTGQLSLQETELESVQMIFIR